MAETLTALDGIAAKIAAGEPLTGQDGRELLATRNLVTLGMLADEARRAIGTDVTYVRVLEVSSSTLAEGASATRAREWRLVDRPATAAEAVAAVRTAASAAGSVPVSAFSLADLAAIAPDGGLHSLLEDLKDAGLALIAGAELDRLERSHLEAAARARLPVARVIVSRAGGDALLAGLLRLRDMQRDLEVVQAVAPLAREVDPSVPTTGYDDVRAVALARLLGIVPAVQVDWALHGPKLAQVALLFGANDLDAVSPLDEAPLGHRRAPLEEVRRNIEVAGFRAVERDGRFVRVDQ